MVGFLNVGNNNKEKLRNAKSDQNIQGKHLVRLISPFLPGKIRPKRSIFYLITYMGQFSYTAKNAK